MALTDMLEDGRKIAFVQWLTTPPSGRGINGVPTTMQGIADHLGVSARTLRTWKNDKAIREAWDVESMEVIGGIDKRQEVLEELRLLALERGHESSSGDYVYNQKQVQSAGLYLKAIGAIAPPAVEKAVKAGKVVTEYTDDELNAMIAQEAQRLLHERSGAANTTVKPSDVSSAS